MLPPTWLTLHTLNELGVGTVDEALDAMRAVEPFSHTTQSVELPDGRMCFMWEGDAGYAECDPDAAGPRFRMFSTPADRLVGDKDELGPLTRGTSILTLERSDGQGSRL